MSETYTKEQYKKDFETPNKKRNALRHALDIRKFEIELYWKRATYFWTFIGATLAAYGVISASEKSLDEKTDLLVIISCLGIVLSLSWYLANRGSKQWQENWENHVDMLEDDVTGPLYKVVLRRSDPIGCKECFEYLIAGPSAFSVSKINQIISLYITIIWIFLLFKSLPTFDKNAEINFEYVFLITITFIFCIVLFKVGRTSPHVTYRPYKGTKRPASIE